MKNKRFYVILAMVLIILLAISLKYTVFKSSPEKPEEMTTQENTTEEITAQESEPEQNGYLSITYTTSDSSVETERMMNFYTYDLATGKLDNRAQIPYSSQYALGVVSLSDNKIYYTHREINEIGNADHLYEYDILDGKSTLLETENRAYNDIVPINGNLLVTTVPAHAIGTAMFDLKEGTFSFLHKQSAKQDGYMDFPYTTRPVALNYNYQYESFINTEVIEDDLYDPDVRRGLKPLDFHISIVDVNFNVKSKYIFTVPSLMDSEVEAVAQTSSDTAILMIDVPSTKAELETEYEFYRINFSDQSCEKIDSPFPKMMYIDNFITVDNGKSYYVLGYTTEGISGLFYYDCSNNNVTPILLDDMEVNDHVVNYCFVKY